MLYLYLHKYSVQKLGKTTRINLPLGPHYHFSTEKGDLVGLLTLKAPITTAEDDKFCDIFPSFDKNKE